MTSCGVWLLEKQVKVQVRRSTRGDGKPPFTNHTLTLVRRRTDPELARCLPSFENVLRRPPVDEQGGPEVLGGVLYTRCFDEAFHSQLACLVNALQYHWCDGASVSHNVLLFPPKYSGTRCAKRSKITASVINPGEQFGQLRHIGMVCCGEGENRGCESGMERHVLYLGAGQSFV